MILAGIFLLLPGFAFSQDSKATGKNGTPAPGETAGKAPLTSGLLRDVVVLSQPQGIRIKMVGEGLAPGYHTFNLLNPARLVIDFPETISSFPKRIIDLNHPLLREIRIGHHPDKVRLVFLFPGKDIPAHRLLKEDGGLVLWIGEAEKESEEARKPPGGEREDRSKIKPSGEPNPADTEAKEGGKPSLKPPQRNKISLDLRDGDIRGVLLLIAQAAQKQIIPSDEVRGTLTLRLVDVPWDQALEAILSICNLQKVEEGNLIRIFPREKS